MHIEKSAKFENCCLGSMEKAVSVGIPGGVMVVVYGVIVTSTEADQSHRSAMLNRSDVTLACKNEFKGCVRRQF